MEYYNYIKSLHLIFVVTWFAGLFYEPRLFIYHIEASKKISPAKEILENQLKIMSRRLWYIIAWPSAILATMFAIWLLVLMPGLLYQSWMLVKIVFIFLLYAYHLKRIRCSWSFNVTKSVTHQTLCESGMKEQPYFYFQLYSWQSLKAQFIGFLWCSEHLA